MRRIATLSMIVFTAALAGCGGSNARVFGDVSYNGKPVEDGSIELVPTDGTAGPSTGGAIKEGRYEVPATVGPVRGGKYKVIITAMVKTGKKGPSPMGSGPPVELVENIIPPEFNTKTTLKLTIAAESTENRHDFHLKRP